MYYANLSKLYGLLPLSWSHIISNSIPAMSQSIPKTTKQWRVVGHNGFDSLEYSEQPIPELGDNQVLIKSEFPVLQRKNRHLQRN